MGNFKRYTQQFLKNAFLRNRLQFLIFFITSRCNCRCSSCFYWQELNKADDLSTEEIEKLCKSLGTFHNLLISGGEPFLRDGLLNICDLFIRYNKISALTVPTNGTYTDRSIVFAENILEKYPHLNLLIAVSIDGFEGLHDEIRGVEGTYKKAINTLRKLSELKSRYDNLEIVVNTVIADKTIKQLPSFMDFIYENFNIDFHDFEILRGDYKDKTLSVPELGRIHRMHHLIIKNRQRYLKRKKAKWLERFAVISLMQFTHIIKERFFGRKKPFFACLAGKNIGAIDANGDIRLCELLPAVGNIRNAGYYFYSVWNSKEADELKCKIKITNCSCTHICFIKLTISGYFRTFFYLIQSYMAYLMDR